MKPYFIKDDDGNYLNPRYIYYIQVIRFCNLGSLFAFETIKKVKTSCDLPSSMNIATYEVYDWMDKFHTIFTNFTEVDPTTSYDCHNDDLVSFDSSQLLYSEIHTSLDIDKISHINSIYENDVFQYFEIVYIDSDQVTIKKFGSEELAQAWIADHFNVL